MVLKGVPYGPEVAQALAHLLAIHIDEAVVHPVSDHRLGFGATLGLEYLGLVMGEPQVMATAMDVELLAEVIEGHRRALDVPSRPAIAPRALPRGLARLGQLPEREVAVVPFARAGVCDSPASTGPHHLQSLAGQLPELPRGRVNLEVDSVIADVGVALALQGGNHVDDFRNRLSDSRVVVCPKDVHRVHGLQVIVDVPVGDYRVIDSLRVGDI